MPWVSSNDLKRIECLVYVGVHMWAANTPCQYLREIEQTLRGGGEYPFNWQTHKSPCMRKPVSTAVLPNQTKTLRKVPNF